MQTNKILVIPLTDIWKYADLQLFFKQLYKILRIDVCRSIQIIILISKQCTVKYMPCDHEIYIIHNARTIIECRTSAALHTWKWFLINKYSQYEVSAVSWSQVVSRCKWKIGCVWVSFCCSVSSKENIQCYIKYGAYG